MQRFLPKRAQALAFLGAFILLNVVGTAVQTQFNLGHLLALGVDVPFSLRLTTTGHDIITMQPLFGSIFGLGFLIAMIVGHFIAALVKILPDVVYALADLPLWRYRCLRSKQHFKSPPLVRRANGTGF